MATKTYTWAWAWAEVNILVEALASVQVQIQVQVQVQHQGPLVDMVREQVRVRVQEPFRIPVRVRGAIDTVAVGLVHVRIHIHVLAIS